MHEIAIYVILLLKIYLEEAFLSFTLAVKAPLGMQVSHKNGQNRPIYATAWGGPPGLVVGRTPKRAKTSKNSEKQGQNRPLKPCNYLGGIIGSYCLMR